MGREALEAGNAAGWTRALAWLVLDDPAHVVLGKEPVRAGDGEVVGYTRSAAYGYSVGGLPYQCLVVGPARTAATIESAIRDATAGAFVTTVDVSANRFGGQGRRGSRALVVRARSGPGSRSFGPGSCAQTIVAQAGVILSQFADASSAIYRLPVRPSYAAYLAACLHDAVLGLD